MVQCLTNILIRNKTKMMFGKNLQSGHVVDRISSNTVGVELGVWQGDSSAKFVTKTKHLHLVDAWAVEPYKNNKEHGDYNTYLSRYSELVGSSNPENFQKYYDKIHESVKEKFKNNNVTIHRMTTAEFFEQFKETVDWIYVDAAHDFNGCYKDLCSSLKIVKSGGIIYGDDYNNRPGVKLAVDAFIKEHNLKFNNFFGNQYEIQVP
jgi:Methyltransferase domain